MDYNLFLKQKENNVIKSGFDIEESELNKNLFDFQKHIVKKALKHGKYAIFADCGLGKTLMQLEWAHQVSKKENKAVLILCPLAILKQTIEEGLKFDIHIQKLESDVSNQGVYITNYDQIDNVALDQFCGVVLDESSILKGRGGKTSTKLIDGFKYHKYKLCCTATPSPNDHMELGNHSEFLNSMSYLEMLSMFFVHDGGETSKWRLRKHAQDNFWKFICSFSISVDNPKTLGFEMDGYDLPEIEYIEHHIEFDNDSGDLFGETAVSATELHRDLKKSFNQRINKTIEIVKKHNGQTIIWTLKNDEANELKKVIEDSKNVQGSDLPNVKAMNLNGFSNLDFENLITKTSIASFGMNYQQCFNMVFTSYDFKFEAFYQAVRRCYRFGQNNKVKVHILVPMSQKNVRTSILEKEKKHKEMIRNMSLYSSNDNFKLGKSNFMINSKEIKTEDYHLLNGDCVQEIKKIEDNKADIVVFSPPFAELYVYSDKKEDMGNVSNYKQFEDHFKYLIPELKRVLKSGRICAIHCMDLPIQKGKEGYIGLRDFSGMITEWFQEQGFIYHARTTIWKNPVTEMQRTKALGLLHKTIKKDSCMSRVGIPDYVLFFRNAGDNETPITHQDTDSTQPDYLPVDLWQKYASPVWMDVDYKRTLNFRSARDGNDEKHICPLQLDTIERILHLYSNEGEVVLSPFGGIGSEGCQALKMGRKSISIELKESYFSINKRNHEETLNDVTNVIDLFS